MAAVLLARIVNALGAMEGRAKTVIATVPAFLGSVSSWTVIAG
jgi:hypothetical protein